MIRDVYDDIYAPDEGLQLSYQFYECFTKRRITEPTEMCGVCNKLPDVTKKFILKLGTNIGVSQSTLT